MGIHGFDMDHRWAFVRLHPAQRSPRPAQHAARSPQHAAGLLATMLILAAFVPAPLHAATFTVTKLTDTDDGTCNADCSLREAIRAANTTAGVDTIILPIGTLTLTLAGSDEDASRTGDLDITDSVVLQGASAGTTIAGRTADRLLHLRAGGLTLRDLTLRDGDAGRVVGGNWTGGNGGAILTEATTTIALERVILRANRGQFGGALHTVGLSVTAVDTTFDANIARVGGALYAGSSGDVRLEWVTLSANTADVNGGALVLTSGADLETRNVTIDGNRAKATGGGLLVGTNPVDDGTDAGLSDVTLKHTTITANAADTDADDVGDGGGIANRRGTINAVTNPVRLNHTLLAGNTDASPTTRAPDCAGEFVSQRFNLVQDTQGCLLTGFLGDDVLGQNPLLGALVLAGGSTAVRLPLTGSPAIDAGDATGATCAADDQRGIPRAFDGDLAGLAICDIGAVEVAQADLALLLIAPARVVRGAPLELALVVRNAGPMATPGSQLRVTLPAGTTLVSYTGTGWQCSTAPGEVTCNGSGVVVRGESPTLLLTIGVPRNARTVVIGAALTSDGFDANRSDNRVTITVPSVVAVYVPWVAVEP